MQLGHQIDESPPALRIATILSLIVGLVGVVLYGIGTVLYLAAAGSMLVAVSSLGAVAPWIEVIFNLIRGLSGFILSVAVVYAAALSMQRRPTALGVAAVSSIIYIVGIEVVGGFVMGLVGVIVMATTGPLAGLDLQAFAATLGAVLVGQFLCLLLWAAARVTFWAIVWSTVRRALNPLDEDE